MDIIINGQQLEFSLESEKTIGDVLKAIEADCTANNAAIIRICIDGKVLQEENFETALNTSLETVKKMQLETINEADALTFLQNTTNDMQVLIEQLLKVPVLLQSNKDNEVSNIVVSFVNIFNNIGQIVYFSTIFEDRFSNFTVDGQNLTDFMQDFTPILQEFETSLSSHDTVLTGDLAEYEIVPRLEAFVKATQTHYGATC